MAFRGDMQALLCARFCRYYHPEKTDEPGCGGLHRLARIPGWPGFWPGWTPPGGGAFRAFPRDPRLLAVCGSCPYLVDGCDFRDPAGRCRVASPAADSRPGRALVPGGGALMAAAPPAGYLRLADRALVRTLEIPCVYLASTDELYELNPEALAGLAACDGTRPAAALGLDPEFQAYCLAEGIWNSLPLPGPAGPGSRRPAPLAPLPGAPAHPALQPGLPPLLPGRSPAGGPAGGGPGQAAGGVRGPGGTPGDHRRRGAAPPPGLEEINRVLAASPLRKVLVSNGLLLDERRLAGLAVDEVQVSLDGLAAGHELLRGPGSFAPALAAARRVKAAGIALSIATMVHAGNREEFPALAELVAGLGTAAWGVDAPCPVGRLAGHPELWVTPAQAAEAMAHAFGGAHHGGRDGFACGAHLVAVLPEGTLAPCAFYPAPPLGDLAEGLRPALARRVPRRLAELPACAACPAGPECGGGCRRRAPEPLAPDPVMCAVFGV